MHIWLLTILVDMCHGMHNFLAVVVVVVVFRCRGVCVCRGGGEGPKGVGLV